MRGVSKNGNFGEIGVREIFCNLEASVFKNTLVGPKVEARLAFV